MVLKNIGSSTGREHKNFFPYIAIKTSFEFYPLVSSFIIWETFSRYNSQGRIVGDDLKILGFVFYRAGRWQSA